MKLLFCHAVTSFHFVMLSLLFILVREQYANLDVKYIEATLGEANLEESEYSRVKEAVIKICDSYS